MSREERVYADPSMNMENEEYWKATKQGKLILKKCDDCGETHFFPRIICPHCQSSNTSWYEASGKGRIYSYSVVRRAPIPYAIAYVTLDEGVSMLTNLVDCDFDDLAVDKEVEVTFRDTEGGEKLPMFRPV
ncbi:Zn-ribbon domain-containing OB-fold protein [Sneathiella limimaris]|uniref:Zn-ribbon domain-containing OB-fold protein n=1 Tax=Sneathiella limimaris TaxID=1964213 RepID=UPI00146E90F1|nr:Zn-ribbon domain-containing OB-fold protein [Sneathiella limimaris]